MGIKVRGSLSLVQVISFSFGVIFLSLLLIMVSLNPCPSDQVFSIYKAALSISLAGLAAVIPGFFRFKYQGIIAAGGAMGVFAFVFLLNPATISRTGNCTFDLTLTFHVAGDRDKLVSGVSATVLFGTSRVEKIDVHEGRVVIHEIHNDLRGKEMILDLNANDDYESKQLRLTIPQEKNFVQIDLAPRSHITRAHGVLLDAQNRPLKFARINIEGTEDTTDVNGMYDFTLPLKAGLRTHYLIYVNNELKYDRQQTLTTDFLGIKVE